MANLSWQSVGKSTNIRKVKFNTLLFRNLNFLKILASYLFSRISHRAYHWGKPIAVSIEPTNRCNLHCPECPSGMHRLTRTRGEISPDVFKSAIDQLSPQLSYLTLYFQGEPYLHPGFFDFVRYARSKNIYVSSSTNGHFLSTEQVEQTINCGLNRLIISLDGINQETYQSYRQGGNFKQVVEGIAKLVEQKHLKKVNHPKIIIQFLVFKTNQHQIAEIRTLGRKLGVDKVEIKTAQFYDYHLGNPLMTDLGKYSRYKKITSPSSSIITYQIKNKLPNHCFRMWSSCVITWDGKVAPCCYDKDANHVMGNIIKTPFHEILKSTSYKNFRKTLLTKRKSVEMCSNCDQKF